QAGDGDSAYRKDAITALGILALQHKKLIPELTPVLMTALKDDDPIVSDAGVQAVSLLGPQVVPALVQLVNDKASPVARRRALSTLGRMGSNAKTAIPVLIESLGDADVRVRRAAAYAVSQVGTGTQAVPALTKLLKDTDDELPELAAYALGEVGGDA